MSSNHYHVISAMLFDFAFIILVINKAEVPDITMKYSDFFFLLFTLYAVRWLADMFIAFLRTQLIK